MTHRVRLSNIKGHVSLQAFTCNNLKIQHSWKLYILLLKLQLVQIKAFLHIVNLYLYCVERLIFIVYLTLFLFCLWLYTGEGLDPAKLVQPCILIASVQGQDIWSPTCSCLLKVCLVSKQYLIIWYSIFSHFYMFGTHKFRARHECDIHASRIT